jgi:hypothetical protein
VTPEEGFFSIRRRASRSFQRERAVMGDEPGPSTFGGSGPSYDQEDVNVPSTPRTSTSLTPSGIVPPPFDLTELGTFAKGSQEVRAIFGLSRLSIAYIIRFFGWSLGMPSLSVL